MYDNLPVGGNVTRTATEGVQNLVNFAILILLHMWQLLNSLRRDRRGYEVCP